jgi:hypothetical protein
MKPKYFIRTEWRKDFMGNWIWVVPLVLVAGCSKSAYPPNAAAPASATNTVSASQGNVSPENPEPVARSAAPANAPGSTRRLAMGR